MSQITKAGTALARESLAKVMDVTGEVLAICSLIHRHAMSYHATLEQECNGWDPDGYFAKMPIKEWNKHQERFEKQLAKRQSFLEKWIAAAVARLPKTRNGETVTVKTGGDPRGPGTYLMIPDGNGSYLNNTWGGAERGWGVCK